MYHYISTSTYIFLLKIEKIIFSMINLFDQFGSYDPSARYSKTRREMDFRQDEPRHAEYLEWCESRPPGVDKTHLAVTITLRRACEENRPESE
mgnify:CR=1 FL=1